jgi:hypothetical protein
LSIPDQECQDGGVGRADEDNCMDLMVIECCPEFCSSEVLRHVAILEIMRVRKQRLGVVGRRAWLQQ